MITLPGAGRSSFTPQRLGFAGSVPGMAVRGLERNEIVSESYRVYLVFSSVTVLENKRNNLSFMMAKLSLSL